MLGLGLWQTSKSAGVLPVSSLQLSTSVSLSLRSVSLFLFLPLLLFLFPPVSSSPPPALLRCGDAPARHSRLRPALLIKCNTAAGSRWTRQTTAVQNAKSWSSELKQWRKTRGFLPPLWIPALQLSSCFSHVWVYFDSSALADQPQPTETNFALVV